LYSSYGLFKELFIQTFHFQYTQCLMISSDAMPSHVRLQEMMIYNWKL